jgi:hypothetical protein
MLSESSICRANIQRIGEFGKFYQEQVSLLLAYAESEFELLKLQEDGQSLRVHLESAWRQTGKKPERLDTGDIPEHLEYIWNWFIELNNTRQHAEYGRLPITYSEMQAWCELTGSKPSSNDVKLIKLIDSLLLKGG